MDQLAIDSTGVTLERNQSILLKEIFGEGSFLLPGGAFPSSGCFELRWLLEVAVV